jgi:hypothetical protein
MNMFAGMKGQAVRASYLGPSDPVMFPHLRQVSAPVKVTPPRTPDRACQKIQALGFRVSVSGGILSIHSHIEVSRDKWEEAFDIIRSEGLM